MRSYKGGDNLSLIFYVFAICSMPNLFSLIESDTISRTIFLCVTTSTDNLIKREKWKKNKNDSLNICLIGRHLIRNIQTLSINFLSVIYIARSALFPFIETCRQRFKKTFQMSKWIFAREFSVWNTKKYLTKKNKKEVMTSDTEALSICYSIW